LSRMGKIETGWAKLSMIFNGKDGETGPGWAKRVKTCTHVSSTVKTKTHTDKDTGPMLLNGKDKDTGPMIFNFKLTAIWQTAKQLSLKAVNHGACVYLAVA